MIRACIVLTYGAFMFAVACGVRFPTRAVQLFAAFTVGLLIGGAAEWEARREAKKALDFQKVTR
jgi:membrane protein CcdC involved in cytochrome C biogenesis